MKSKKRELNQQESELIEQLRRHPEIMRRVQSILEIAQTGEGPLKTADQIEELLVQEMRRLGNATMREWATGAEERVSTELVKEDSTVLSRKKKR
jgi:uncharacterized protein with PhoU and TrkA domain